MGAVDAFFGVISAVVVAARFVIPVAIMALLALMMLRRVRPRLEAH